MHRCVPATTPAKPPSSSMTALLHRKSDHEHERLLRARRSLHGQIGARFRPGSDPRRILVSALVKNLVFEQPISSQPDTTALIGLTSTFGPNWLGEPPSATALSSTILHTATVHLLSRDSSGVHRLRRLRPTPSDQRTYFNAQLGLQVAGGLLPLILACSAGPPTPSYRRIQSQGQYQVKFVEKRRDLEVQNLRAACPYRCVQLRGR